MLERKALRNMYKPANENSIEELSNSFNESSIINAIKD